MANDEINKFFSNLLKCMKPIIEKTNNNNGSELDFTDVKIKNFFGSYFEIYESYQTLLDYEIYISNFPYENTRVNKIRHLKTTIANYFNEMYVLEERLKQFTNLMLKTYKNNTEYFYVVEQWIEKVFNSFSKGFEDIRGTRNSSVHVKRFSSQGLEFLTMMDILQTEEGKTFGIYDLKYEKQIEEWKTTIEENNFKINKSINEYTRIFNKILFELDYINKIIE